MVLEPRGRADQVDRGGQPFGEEPTGWTQAEGEVV